MHIINSIMKFLELFSLNFIHSIAFIDIFYKDLFPWCSPPQSMLKLWNFDIPGYDHINMVTFVCTIHVVILSMLHAIIAQKEPNLFLVNYILYTIKKDAQSPSIILNQHITKVLMVHPFTI